MQNSIKNPIQRLIKFSTQNHILLFGPRGVGKSTWLLHCFNPENTLWINLLNAIESLRTLKQLSEDFGLEACEAVCFSQDTYSRKHEHIIIYPWREGLKKYFLPDSEAPNKSE